MTAISPSARDLDDAGCRHLACALLYQACKDARGRAEAWRWLHSKDSYEWACAVDFEDFWPPTRKQLMALSVPGRKTENEYPG